MQPPTSAPGRRAGFGAPDLLRAVAVLRHDLVQRERLVEGVPRRFGERAARERVRVVAEGVEVARPPRSRSRSRNVAGDMSLPFGSSGAGAVPPASTHGGRRVGALDRRRRRRLSMSCSRDVDAAARTGSGSARSRSAMPVIPLRRLALAGEVAVALGDGVGRELGEVLCRLREAVRRCPAGSRPGGPTSASRRGSRAPSGRGPSPSSTTLSSGPQRYLLFWYSIDAQSTSTASHFAPESRIAFRSAWRSCSLSQSSMWPPLSPTLSPVTASAAVDAGQRCEQDTRAGSVLPRAA